MADSTYTDYSLQMLAEFADGDTRTLSMDNPNSASSLGAAVYSLQSFLQNNSIIIGDKTGAAFTQFRYANKVTKNKTVLDISERDE